MKNDLFQNEYKILNSAQKEAVNELYGPTMVVAGPGTGKTQIIGMRTANIIIKTGVNPENILITTFTEAGVIAIRQRLLKFIGNDAYKVCVSTIHSLSQEIIQTHPEKFLEYKASMAIDEVDIIEIIKDIIDKLIEKKKIVELTNDFDKYYYLKSIVGKIKILKQEGISLKKFKLNIKNQEKLNICNLDELVQSKKNPEKFLKTKVYQNIIDKNKNNINKLNELVIFFNEYQKYLRKHSMYDFNDMINFVLDKLKSDESLKSYYAEKFQFIMLDEYQDTNDAQNQIIDTILSVSIDEPNIMVVGDDDQSIYRFQGANIENMLDFSTKYKNTKFIVLINNYRSNQQILDLSSKLIENNNERLSNKIGSINKSLISSGNGKDAQHNVKLFEAKSDIEEKSYIVNKIKELSINTKLKNIAIIVRGNKEVEEWSQLLLQNGIEVESKLKTNILNTNYIKFILDYLEIITNPYADEEKIITIMRSSIIGIKQTDIFRINRRLYNINYSKKYKTKIMDFLLDENLEKLQLSDFESCINFRKNLEDFQEQLSYKNIIEFFSYFLNRINLIEYIEKNGNFDDIQDIYTFFNKIKDYSKYDNSFNIEKLLTKINLYKKYNYPISRQILNNNIKGVQILTAHSSKGLEFNNVFIPGLYNGNWQGKIKREVIKLPEHIAGQGLQNDDFQQIEEDRRLFFVAITRAMDNLYLSYPAGIGTKPLLISSFLIEIKELTSEPTNTITGVKNIKNIIKNELINELIKYSDSEFDYIHSFLENYKLSASDLNTFLEDPLLFLNRVIFKYPFIDNQFTVFGKVYHRTLELFYLKYKDEGNLPKKSYLISTFKLLLKKEVLTPDEQTKLLEKGITGLEGYFDIHMKKNEEPLELEYSFRNKGIIFDGIPLTGTIDKIDKIGLTDNNSESSEGQLAFFKEKVSLIDYKTGKVKSVGIIKGIDKFGNKKTDKKEGKYFRQLMFYKLLCEQDNDFKDKFDIGEVAIDFVEGKDNNYKYVKLDISNEEYEEFKEELKTAWKDINSETFWRDVLGKIV